MFRHGKKAMGAKWHLQKKGFIIMQINGLNPRISNAGEDL